MNCKKSESDTYLGKKNAVFCILSIGHVLGHFELDPNCQAAKLTTIIELQVILKITGETPEVHSDKKKTNKEKREKKEKSETE